MAGKQKKRDLELAGAGRPPRDRLFYKLMAEVAPAVTGMASRNVEQVGASIIYDIALRVASSILLEVDFNLTGGGATDINRLTADFRTALEQLAGTQIELDPIPRTPKFDA